MPRIPTVNSLPLMGIGNRLAVDLVLQPRLERLITPHGDREPHRARDRRPRQLRNSLPLMGIGNQRIVEDNELRRPGLITPHGDREPFLVRTFRILAGYEPSKNGGRQCANLRLDPPLGAVLLSGARDGHQRTDQFLPCHSSSAWRIGPPNSSLLSRCTSTL